MFKLKGKTTAGVRIGKYVCTTKTVSTPTYFFISNIGGGGTNVSRIFPYFDLFAGSTSNLLLNYYYLLNDFKKSPSFDQDLLENIPEYDDIVEFMHYGADKYFERGTYSKMFQRKPDIYSPLALLDSGSGNIFRDLAKEGKINKKNFEDAYQSEVEKYEDFATRLNFDICIAMDIAGKYTKKQGEHLDENYIDLINKFSTNDSNLKLLSYTLKHRKRFNKHMSFAPIHGLNERSYSDFTIKILELEKKCGENFDGFAMGGLGAIRKRSEQYKIVRSVRNSLEKNNDERPLHVLGTGALQNIIPMSVAGADSFDCHSPWRRASEGKYVIPLITKTLDILQNKSFWDYKFTKKIKSDDFGCDCPVCKEFEIEEIDSMLVQGSEEGYFAKILLFKHNIYQQEQTCELTRKDDLKDIVKNFPENRDKESILTELRLNQ